ncbi:hypothetical protein ZWY2020_009092 [Hordeum vulgare]|nr:hypothetical protein ZWY2020_009092 [Hordeum vulgare]
MSPVPSQPTAEARGAQVRPSRAHHVAAAARSASPQRARASAAPRPSTPPCSQQPPQPDPTVTHLRGRHRAMSRAPRPTAASAGASPTTPPISRASHLLPPGHPPSAGSGAWMPDPSSPSPLNPPTSSPPPAAIALATGVGHAPQARVGIGPSRDCHGPPSMQRDRRNPHHPIQVRP